MRIAMLATSSLSFPSPRGRWLPVARELRALGLLPHLLMLHHAYDTLPAHQRRMVVDGVATDYVSQMHVYGAVGQRRYFGAARLVQVSLLAAQRLAHAAIALRPDAIHVCKPQPINGLAGVLAARALGVPLFVDCDDYEAGGNRFAGGWQRRIVQFWEDWLPQQAHAVTVNTRFLEQRNRALGVPAERLVYVPNGITAHQQRPADGRAVAGLRAALGLGDAPVVMYVGTLSRTTHNIDLLIDAFGYTLQRLPAARLVLVGAGEDRPALEQYAARYGERVVFAGPLPPSRIREALAIADCTVDPVGDDGVAAGRSPLKIVESLAAGVPVVTGAVGDRPEMLSNDAGVVVAPGDAAALGAAIAHVLSDGPHRAALAAAAARRAAAYRWETLAQRWAQVYTQNG